MSNIWGAVQPASHQAWCADCRMRRERLIRPTVPTPPVDLIRRASIASGMVCRLPDAA
ncbi:hypothetical protein [Escherichia coli]|uniref:hypothetical protein n=1 Tax=Escherichia coli TaxID=562 RepID=UPI003A86BB9E